MKKHHLETGLFEAAMGALAAEGVVVKKPSLKQVKAVKMRLRQELDGIQDLLIAEYVGKNLGGRRESAAAATVVVTTIADDVAKRMKAEKITADGITVAAPDQLLATCVSGEQLANLLHTSTATIHNWMRDGELLTVRLETGKLRYPTWQVVDGRTLPRLGEIIAFLAETKRSDRDQLRWFLNPNAQLGDESPLTLLRRNQVDAVVGAAEALAERSR